MVLTYKQYMNDCARVLRSLRSKGCSLPIGNDGNKIPNEHNFFFLIFQFTATEQLIYENDATLISISDTCLMLTDSLPLSQENI